MNHLYRAWGVPAGYQNKLLATVPDDLKHWIIAAALGRLWMEGRPEQGWGLVLVGNLEDNDRVLGGTVSHLVRQSPFRSRYPKGAPRDFMRRALLEDVHYALREDPTSAHTWAAYPVLALDILSLKDQWAVNSVASVCRRRMLDGMPTIYMISEPSYLRVVSDPVTFDHLAQVMQARTSTVSTKDIA